ncbi:MAG: valine--tRNA ligase [Deltaproteobacteria bacterium]|nr:valine--tRNA ligase [Deltaproteobacteria bacterium]
MTAHRPKTLDPTTLPAHFDASAAERRWGALWDELGVYRWDPERPREDTYVVDTPPPTVSGSLHMGHVFSYTHTDVLVRQRRMLGKNIFYPMGWDDNGLPTERRVQNYFHVRCDAALAYDPSLAVTQADDARRKGERPRVVSRRNFIELCHTVTSADERAFEDLFRRIALSVDWSQTYATIDDNARRTAQASFLDLFRKGLVHNPEAPTMWDVDFQTAVAQAEVEDRPRDGAFHHLEFGVEGSDQRFTIATTRPELLAACVAVTAHPKDPRYQGLFGRRAITPLFRAPVPIFPSELADPEKGTGVLMVCTFGDQTDVHWWRSEGLCLRQIIGRDGRLVPVTFGTEAFPSANPEAANRYYEQLQGKTVASAQKAVVELLRDPAGSATGHGPALVQEPVKLQHPVKHYEKGDRPLEFVTSRQWFVKLLPQRAALLARGDQVRWWPDFMRARYRNWTENLGQDWCVSRQRYFGVPIPVWYRVREDGTTDYNSVLVAEEHTLPIDPMSDAPPGYAPSQRGAPGGFVGDPDVFDTWFTSSLTPQLSSRWATDPARHKKLFPADLRPQSHEIIRTWAFYTLAKAHLHEGTVPWHNVAISGWILDPDRKKMSKSVGNVVTPLGLLDSFSADGVRYWAAGARLGADTAFDEKVLKVGKRLVTKLFNAGKYVLSQEASGALGPEAITHELDRAFARALGALVGRATACFEGYEFAHALLETEQFFWSQFTDTYLELSKARARGDHGGDAGRRSAVATLRLALDVLLRLFAPVLPYITEEVWSWAFAEEKGQRSIHRAPWPRAEDFEGVTAPEAEDSLEVAGRVMAAINKRKSEQGASVGRVVTHLELTVGAGLAAGLARVAEDVFSATRVQSHRVLVSDEADALAVTSLEVAPKEPAAEA